MNPPFTDSQGVTWYRPSYEGDTPPKMWGWTNQPEQAHPNYDRHRDEARLSKTLGEVGQKPSCAELEGQNPPPRGPHVLISKRGQRDFCGGCELFGKTRVNVCVCE